MALHTTTTAYQMPYQMPHVAEPVAIVLAHQASQNAKSDQYICGVPPNASGHVKATRRISGMTIVIHASALFFGNCFWGQWIASLIAILMGCVVLFQFSKCAYTAAAFWYPITMIFDILSALFCENNAETSIRLLSTVPGLGAVCLLLRTIVTCGATCNWEESGAADAVAVVECRCRVQVAYHAAYRLTSATQQAPGSTSRRVTTGPV